MFIRGKTVWVTELDVACFNRGWPCSELNLAKMYWFEFDARGDLVDTSVSEHEDGSAASAIADDCRVFYQSGKRADWDMTVLK